jgi:multidrug resistance efflux pump
MTQNPIIAVGAAVLIIVGAVFLSTAPGRQDSHAEDGVRSSAPLMVRGFTDASAGEAVIAGVGSDRLLELRVAEGQSVKRGQVIAVLANYPAADIAVRSAEAQLLRIERRHESLAQGIRPSLKTDQSADGQNGGDGQSKSKKKDSAPSVGVAEQEAIVRLSAEESKLKQLEMERSGLPADQKDLEIRISAEQLEHDQAKLRVLKETLASDLAQSEIDIEIQTAELERARRLREQGLVRSPLDGVVVQILTRPGERIERGIAQIVDMSRLRVVADIDEVLVNRIKLGSKVNVTFHGEKTIHRGRIVRIASAVKRMASVGSLGTGSTKIRVVPVEIALDDPSQMPHILGREAEVTFLEP